MAKSRSEEKRSSSNPRGKAPLPVYGLTQALVSHAGQLGITSAEVHMVLFHSKYWWTETSLPFVGDRATATALGISMRQVQRLKVSLRRKGYLHIIDRYERSTRGPGARRTSSVLDYGPLVETLRQLDSDKNDIGPTTDLSGAPTTETSYFRNTSTFVDVNKGEVANEITSSIQAGDYDSGDPGENDNERSLRSRSDCIIVEDRHRAPGEDPMVNDDSYSSRMKNAASLIEPTKARTDSERVSKKLRQAERAKARADQRAEQRIQERGRKEEARMELEKLKEVWRVAMRKSWPEIPTPRRLKPKEVGMLNNLIARWGLEKATDLIEKTVANWTFMLTGLKSAPEEPVLAFLVACDTHFIRRLDKIVEYENLVTAHNEAVKALEAWYASQPEDNIRSAPHHLELAVEEAQEALRTAGRSKD